MAEPFDYAEAAADALELIAEFGQRGAVRRTTVTGGGPDDPNGGTRSEFDYPAHLVVLPINGQKVGEDVADTAIRQTDVQIYMAVGQVTPTTSDRIVTASGIFVILRCNTLAPAGVAVMHDIIGRA